MLVVTTFIDADADAEVGATALGPADAVVLIRAFAIVKHTDAEPVASTHAPVAGGITIVTLAIEQRAEAASPGMPVATVAAPPHAAALGIGNGHIQFGGVV